jgi:hypothetical protein
MNKTEHLAIGHPGAEARCLGESFHANSHYLAEVPIGKACQSGARTDICVAWAGGRLEEDVRRTQAMGRMLRPDAW